MLRRIKPFMLPAAMLSGILFHSQIGSLAWLTPYLIFMMLMVTFCKIDFNRLRPSAMTWWLLSIQLGGGALALYGLRSIDLDMAQGVMICLICPTATAAPVVTGMLGGNVATLVAYSLASNMVCALIAPLMLTAAGAADVDFVATMWSILAKVGPMIIVPLILAVGLRKFGRPIHKALSEHQSISFYLWAVSLFIVVGKSVSFVMAEPADRIGQVVWLALAAGAICALQFGLGRKIGAAYGDKISGAQGLGQKNTVLAIWLALNFLNPISSVAPAAYIAWQNTINSIQLYYRQKSSQQKN